MEFIQAMVFYLKMQLLQETVKDAGITLIGPSPEAMEVMGDKLAAKAAVKILKYRWFLEQTKLLPIYLLLKK